MTTIGIIDDHGIVLQGVSAVFASKKEFDVIFAINNLSEANTTLEQTQPQVLFLDEPTVGIDAQSRHFILNTIHQLQQSGTTIVYTSHYMEEIQSICDVLAIIDHGKLLLQDTLASILQRAETLPIAIAKKNAQRLEDFYLSLTNTALRD